MANEKNDVLLNIEINDKELNRKIEASTSTLTERLSNTIGKSLSKFVSGIQKSLNKENKVAIELDTTKAEKEVDNLSEIVNRKLKKSFNDVDIAQFEKRLQNIKLSLDTRKSEGQIKTLGEKIESELKKNLVVVRDIERTFQSIESIINSISNRQKQLPAGSPPKQITGGIKEPAYNNLDEIKANKANKSDNALDRVLFITEQKVLSLASGLSILSNTIGNLLNNITRAQNLLNGTIATNQKLLTSESIKRTSGDITRLSTGFPTPLPPALPPVTPSGLLGSGNTTKLIGQGNNPKLLGQGESAPLAKIVFNFGKELEHVLSLGIKTILFGVIQNIQKTLQLVHNSVYGGSRALNPSSLPPIQLSGQSIGERKLLTEGTPDVIDITPQKRKRVKNQPASVVASEAIKDVINEVSSDPVGKKVTPKLEKINEDIIALIKKSVQGTISGKEGKDLTDQEKIKLERLVKTADKLIASIREGQNKLSELGKSANSVKSPVSELEKALELVTHKLTQFGINEKTIASLTKDSARGIAFLKEQYNLLSDEIGKGKNADADKVFSIFNRIQNAEELAKSRLKTLDQNRGDIIGGKFKESYLLNIEKANKQSIDDYKNRIEISKKLEEQEKKANQAREIRILRENKLNKPNLESIAEGLREKRKLISKQEDIPVNVLNKQTRQYDSTIVRLETDLENLNREFESGNISVADASKKYQKLNNDLNKLKIGIDNIDVKRLSNEFKQEEADPRRLSYRLGILAFTLNSVGQTLQNFSRSFFSLFDQLGQAAEPVERLTNSLSLQVKQGEITVDQQGTILKRLREIGDLPGSSVEDANATYNSLQKVNVSLQERLDLTEGIAKIAASPGGTKDSAKQLSDVISAISLEGTVDEDRFKTLRRSGGRVVSDLIKSLGFTGGKDIEKYGINNFIGKVAESLKTLETPASTTSDRINRLKSRMSELGLIFGKVVGPGLDKFNLILRDQIVPVMDSLIKRFDALPDSVKSAVGTFIVSVPVIAGLAGGIISLAGAIGFAVSGLRQVSELKKFWPQIKEFLSFGGKSATVATEGAVGVQEVGLITKGLGGILNLAKGLLSPLGIIISIFTALYDNVNRVRERIVVAFTTLNDAALKLTNALGIQNGGLLWIFEKIFAILGSIFNLIGGGALNIIVGYVNALTDVVNNLTQIVEYFKSGDVLNGFAAIGKLIYNMSIGFITTVAQTLAAFFTDVIASVIEKTIGEGRISGALRQGANEIRKSYGQDIESLDRRKEALKVQNDINDLKGKELDLEKQLAEEQTKAEEARKEILTRTLKELNDLIDKTKDEYFKFQNEQVINRAKATLEIIKDSTNTSIQQFKELANSTSRVDVITKQYSNTLTKLKTDQTNFYKQQLEIKRLSTLSEFRQLVSPLGDLKPLYEQAKAGRVEFGLLVDQLNKVRTTSDLGVLTEGLKEVERLSSLIDLNGLGENFPVLFKNVTEKTRSVMESFRKESAQAAIEYKNRLEELRKFELERKAALEIEALNAKIAYENRQEELKRQLEEIRQRRQELIDERNDLLEGSKLAKTNKNERLKAAQEKERQVRELENQIKIEEANFISRQKISPELAGLDFKQEPVYLRLKSQIKEVEESFKQIGLESREVFKEEVTNLYLERLKEFSSVLSGINNIADNLAEPLSKVIAALFPSTKNNPGLLLKDLVDIGKLPSNSIFSKEASNILSDFAKGIKTSSQAMEELIQLMVKFQNSEINQKVVDAFYSFRKGALDFNNWFQNDENVPKLKDTTRSGVVDFLSSFGKTSGFFENIKKNPNAQYIFSSNRENDVKFNELLVSIASEADSRIAGEKLLGLIEQLAGSPDIKERDSLQTLLEKLFSSPGINELLKSQALELVTRAVKAFDAQREKQAADVQAELQTRLNVLENKFNLDAIQIDTSISESERRIEEINGKVQYANEKERKNLLKQQRDIKVQLIDFNYQKLDLEAAYNIQKEIIQANGDQIEISRIRKQGEERRKLLIEQRDKQLRDLVGSGGANVNRKGQVVDSTGKPIIPAGPTTSENIGTESSGTITNSTKPITHDVKMSTADVILNKINKINEALDTTKNKALAAGSALMSLWDRLASGENILDRIKEVMGGASLDMEKFGDIMGEVGKTIAVVVAQGLGKVLADALVNGISSIKEFGKVVGDMLIQIGIMLVQSGIAAIVLGTIGTLVPALRFFGGPDSIAAGAVATAVGAGMILLGKSMGGGAKTASTSNTGTTNSASTAAGTSGQTEYDPQNDPKLMYQRALRAQVYIDIKRDDGSIVKAVVKQVNRNPSFRNLIGNERTGFVL